MSSFRDFLRKNFHGILQVKLLSGKNLVKMDMFGKSDPYVTLTAGGGYAQSSIKNNTLNPEWNEDFSLYIK